MSLFATFPPPLRRFIEREVHAALPPPFDDTQEERDIRDLVAMAAVARLTPMNMGEALLATQAIAAEAHARQALQSAGRHRDDFRLVAQCRAQSAMMTRQATQLRKTLRSVQEERRWAEYLHQQDLQAAETAREEEAPDAKPDAEMRRPAWDWLDETRRRQSRGMGQNPDYRSYETKSGISGVPGVANSSDDADLAVLAGLAAGSARNHGALPPRAASGAV